MVKAKTFVLTIEPDVMDVLRGAIKTGTSVRITQQLDRKLYERVNKIMETAGGKWNRSAKAHIFSEDAMAQLMAAISTGAIEDKKKSNQAFYTPADVADTVADLALLLPGTRILEPSAGHGALADACLRRGMPASHIMCVEKDEVSSSILRTKGYDVRCMDFLEWDPRTAVPCDRVVMNPPFSNRQYIHHTLHAFKFLKPWGLLVAIIPPSWSTDNTALGAEFRRLVVQCSHEVHDVPAGSFSESGTNIATCILVLEKPGVGPL